MFSLYYSITAKLIELKNWQPLVGASWQQNPVGAFGTAEMEGLPGPRCQT